MKLLTENRAEFTNALIEINPFFVIAPFGFNVKGFEKKLMSIITRPKTKSLQSNNWKIKTNTKIHSKLAIGSKGIVLGSWNFTTNSTENAHECSLLIYRSEAPELWTDCYDYFLKVWGRKK